MNNSLPYDTAGTSSTPSSEAQPVASVRERNHLWSKDLTRQELDAYVEIARNVAYLVLQHADEAAEIAHSVIEELCRKSAPDIPLEAQVRVLARSRAIDRLRSQRFKFWQKWRPLYTKNVGGDECERQLASLATQGPEDIVIRNEEDTEFMNKLSWAIGTLDPTRRACFVLRYVEGLEPREIAQELHVSAKKASALACSAREQVRERMKEGE